MSGKENEDRYLVSVYPINARRAIPSVLAVISDGIGGHRAGEIAAEIAVKTIHQTVADCDLSEPIHTLREAIARASQSILDQSDLNKAYFGMGATCACGWVIGDQLYTATVGDSRIYLLRDNILHQVSTDHTWIQEALDTGLIDPNETKGHPNSHIIRRYLGSRQPVRPDFRLRLNPGENDAQAESNQGMHLLPGDLVLLCSDGLTDMLADDEIQQTINHLSPNEALTNLITLANARGGHDNITIIMLSVPEADYAGNHPALRNHRPSLLWLWTCLSIIALALCGTMISAGSFWLWVRPTSLNPPSNRTPVPVTRQSSPMPDIPTLITPATPSLPPLLSPSSLPNFQATLTPWPTNTPAP
jgi:protein phosphatase